MCNGVIDQTTTEPVTSHVYNEKFDGVMQVRIWANNDTVSNISAPVKVGVVTQKPATPAAPKVTAEIVQKQGNQATVRLSWQPTDDLTDKWVIRQNDDYLGCAVGQQRQLEIENVDLSRGELSIASWA